MTKKRLIVITILIIAGSISAAGFIYFRLKDTKKQPLESHDPVTVAVKRGNVKKTLLVPGILVCTRRVNLSFNVGGKMAEVRVRPGDLVRSGDVLAFLEPAELAEGVKKSEEELVIQQTRLVQLLHPPAAYDLSSAEAALDKARAEYQALFSGKKKEEITLAEDDLKRQKIAFEEAQTAFDGIIQLPGEERKTGSSEEAEQALERARIIYKSVRMHTEELQNSFALREKALSAEVQQAQAVLMRLKEGVDQEEIDVAKAKIALAQIYLAQAKRKLTDSVLIAPFNGVITDVKEAPGSLVSRGQLVLTMIDPLSLEIEASLIEEDVPYVKAGMWAECFFDARPEDILSARIDRIVPDRRAGERPLYTVYITLDKESDIHDLLPGMTVDSSIVLDQRLDVLIIPRILVRSRPNGTAKVEVWNGREIEPRSIKVGLRGDLNREILDGLTEGEMVLQR